MCFGAGKHLISKIQFGTSKRRVFILSFFSSFSFLTQSTTIYDLEINDIQIQRWASAEFCSMAGAYQLLYMFLFLFIFIFLHSSFNESFFFILTHSLGRSLVRAFYVVRYFSRCEICFSLWDPMYHPLVGKMLCRTHADALGRVVYKTKLKQDWKVEECVDIDFGFGFGMVFGFRFRFLFFFFFFLN
jgi:hypothetical protein